MVGVDYPGMRPALEVAVGDMVKAGQVVLRDRKRPEIAFAAPISGKVTTIDYGPRKTLSALVVQAGKTADKPAKAKAKKTAAGKVRQTLLERGMWPAFRTRPFGHIPDSDATPDSIFVTATKSSPLAPDPAIVLEGQSDIFAIGVESLGELTDGTVYVCQGRGDPYYSGSDDRTKTVLFSGGPPAGFAGTQINRLRPVSAKRQVWSIGYQDVLAIGHLLQTGQYLSERVVSIAGPGAAKPRLVRTVLGTGLRELSQGEVRDKASMQLPHILSGDVFGGREAAFLGRYHEQMTISRKGAGQSPMDWLSGHIPNNGALVPLAALESALPFNILPVPLMRALSVGDSEAAERLGCLELLEEDVAILTHLCTSGANYGVLLRQVLDELAEDVA